MLGFVHGASDFNVRKKEVKKTQSREIRIQELLTTPLVWRGFFKVLLLCSWRGGKSAGAWVFKKDIRLQPYICLVNLKP